MNKSSLLILAFFSLLLSSCLKNDIEEQEAEEKAKIQSYIKGKNFTELPSGIYIKFHHLEDTLNSPHQNMSVGQTLVVNFTGGTTDGDIFETTDSIIGKANFPNLYFVYGPHRIRKGYTKSGIDTALFYLDIGDSVTIVLPSNWAGFDYIPQVYDLQLVDIIENDTLNETNQFNNYFVQNDFNESHMYGSGIYWKMIRDVTTEESITCEMGDTAVIVLTARYAEDYYDNGLGRIFYPLAKAPDTTLRIFEDSYYFPFVPAIDTMLSYMNKGDIYEITTMSNFAYGKTGFNDPYYGLTIVPPYMPVHYRIELIEVRKNTY